MSFDKGSFEVEVRIKYRPRRFYADSAEKMEAQRLQSVLDRTAIIWEKKLEESLEAIMKEDYETILPGMRISNATETFPEVEIP